MNIPEFRLERVQSLYENTVAYNLTESGFHPYSLEELLLPEELAEVNALVLGYGQTNGSIELRETIASLYPGSSLDDILVTNGSAEANFTACHTLLEPGDEVLMMVPNYMQIWGIAEEIGAIPKAFHLREENAWKPDLDELASLISPRTKMIAVCNPNNPTGYVLSEAEMDEIVRLAAEVGAWIYADEVYRGAELKGPETPSFYGRYDKVVVSGGLSKAYALPGLRVGWLVGPRDIIDQAWAYHDYTSITASVLSHKVAHFALSPHHRQDILQRNQELLRTNLAVLEAWIQPYQEYFHFHPPLAGGMAFLRYHFPQNSTALSEQLRLEKSVFVVAGDCFGMDPFLRIGIGAETAYLKAGLLRLAEGLKAFIQLS
ncbi:MAG: aminotransferase class I/II-fold pyridoxal phosphate-dependent enzyme [Bacteroidota bacterium]